MVPRSPLPVLLACILASACSPRGDGPMPPPSVGDMCRPAQEAECITRTQGWASRAGNLLRIGLDDGKAAEFRSFPEACADGDAARCVLYRLDGYRPAEDVFVVAESGYGRGRHLVVHRGTGSRTSVDNHRPHFSPTGGHFAGVMSSQTSVPGQDLAIWSAGGAEPRLLWSHETAGRGRALYEFVAWQGERTVVLRVSCRASEAAPPKVGEARIVREDSAWTLSQPDECP